MNFVKFVRVDAEIRNPSPVTMAVGQVVAREPCSEAYRAGLKTMMRKQIEMGKEFSVHDDAEKFVIRRDK